MFLAHHTYLQLFISPSQQRDKKAATLQRGSGKLQPPFYLLLRGSPGGRKSEKPLGSDMLVKKMTQAAGGGWGVESPHRGELRDMPAQGFHNGRASHAGEGRRTRVSARDIKEFVLMCGWESTIETRWVEVMGVR